MTAYTRPVTERMARALQDGSARCVFVAIEHPSGTGYFCSGVGSITWNGHTWTGTGVLGGISPIKRTSEIAIQDIAFTLSGIDANVAAGLPDNVRNLNGSAWLACLDDQGAVIADPYQLTDSELDYQTYEVADDGTVTIQIIAHSGFYTLDRGVEEAWTPQNQKLAFSTDTGLDKIPLLQNQDLQWTPV